MPRVRAFSPTWIESLKPQKKRRDFTEPGRRGFMLRVWPGGDKTFVYRYMRSGKSRILTIGPYPAITLERAHKLHSQALEDLQAGLDPIDAKDVRRAEQERAKAARGGGTTVRQLVDEFLRHGLVRGDGQPYEEPEQVSRLLRVEVLGQRYERATKTYRETGAGWADKKLDSVTGREAVELCQKIEDRGSRSTARMTRRYLKRMFGYAASAYLIPSNPLAELKGGKSGKRQRFLTQDEIAKVWKALSADDAPMAADTRVALKLLLVTGQRCGELCAAEWQHVDLGAKAWTLPAANTKSRREHQLPLPSLAVELFKQLQAMHPESAWIIPAAKGYAGADLTKPRDPHSLAHATRDHADKFGIPQWAPHDLRRTVRTHLARLKVRREVCERILNHAQPELDQVYDRHEYMPEMKAALAKWDKELRRITA